MDRDLTFRDAREGDAEGLSEIGAATFAETFGHLYPPDHLKRYLDETYALARMKEDLRDPEVEIRIAFSGKKMVAYCKIGPVKLPFDIGALPRSNSTASMSTAASRA